MKHWLVILCLLLFGCASRLDTEGEAAYTTLKSVPFFDAGGFIVGVTDSELSLRVLLKQNQAENALQSLLKEGNPAGQIWALIGLKSADPVAFEKAVTPFLAVKTKVRIKYGDIEYEDTVAKIVEDIRKGNYPLYPEKK